MRQLWDGKGSADIESMDARDDGRATRGSAAGPSPAPTPAPATARAIAAYLGKGDRFDRAIAEFSAAYADQNEADYAVLIEAERTGDLKVERGL